MLQTNRDTLYLARHTAIRAGVPIEVPALNVNRLCGSGFQAVISAAHDLVIGPASVALSGGAECMSEAPFAVRNLRFGTQLGTTYQASFALVVIVFWSVLPLSVCNKIKIKSSAKNGSGQVD